jgi:hypothetical protein
MQGKTNAATMLSGLMEPLGRCLTPESAREILAVRADDAATRRVEELAAKCDDDALTPEERAEYQLFIEVGDFIALLKAKAQRYLRGSASS